jgi:O-antigen/teichoic acid export membrane protein
MFLIPLSVLLTGVYQILNYWSSRKKQFRRLAIRQITQSISSSSVKLGVGLIKPSPGGLIAGNIIGQISATSVLCFLIWRDEKEQIRFIKKERIKQLAVEFKNFPIFNVPQAFLDSFSANSIIFIISSFFTATILGLYSFATSMVTFPMRILGNSITQVFFQKASEIHSNNHNLWPDIKKLIIRLALTGLPVFILILLFAPEIFSIVFGSKWHEAGVYAKILTPYLFATFIGAPISSIPMILNKQKQFFRISLIGNVGLPFLLFGLIKIFSDLKFSLICWSIAGIVFYAIVFFWIRFISKDQSNYCMNNNE